MGLQTKTVSPNESQQVIQPDVGYDGLIKVSVGAIDSTYVGSAVPRKASADLTVSGNKITAPTGYYSTAASKTVAAGTAGTPVATKGAVSNHAISVTPSVTNTTGYITGGAKSGAAVSVAASELVSGTLSITDNGTKDVTNYKSVNVNVDYFKQLKTRSFKIVVHVMNWSTGANITFTGINFFLRKDSSNRVNIGKAYTDGSGIARFEIPFNSSGIVPGANINLSTHKYLDFDPLSSSWTWDISQAGRVRNFISGTNISKNSQGNWDDGTIGGSYTTQGIICEFEAYFKAV